MSRNLSRRDFLKLASLSALGIEAQPVLRLGSPRRIAEPGRQNVLLLLFDAFSAADIPFFGYSRDTTPNLARLARRAVVYRDHYAASNFTTPGTASLLTGTLPWTHRAFQLNNNVAEPFRKENVFGVFDDYYRVAYTQNPWANNLLHHLETGLEDLIPMRRTFLRSSDSLIERLFGADDDISSVAWSRNMSLLDDGYSFSLFASHLYDVLQERRVVGMQSRFPRGLPNAGFDSEFVLEEAIDQLGFVLQSLPQPFLAYFHLLPPHGPYRTPREYFNHFKGDGWVPVRKPVDPFAHGDTRDFQYERRAYDEYLLYVDQEFARLYEGLAASGVLANTWLVLTTDHGEMFERGLLGHGNPSLYQPVIHEPLFIFEPGREAGLEITAQTSALDLLATLAHLTGHPIPDWAEGQVLPPYKEAASGETRGIHAVFARSNPQNAPLERVSVTLIKGNYKLHYYKGYGELNAPDSVQLYDIEADPEELENLADSRPDVRGPMLDQIKAELAEKDRPYL